MPELLVLAAGMGSRYGGLKQLDPVGPGGETLLDYSVYDAIRAGFSRAVFLIRRDIEQEFRAKVGARYEGKIPVAYAFQALDELPGGFVCAANRTKPWGTAHAIWCARRAIQAPFAAINADDFYGADTYRVMSDFLNSVDPESKPARFAMAAFRLERTLSTHGSVARGICEIGPGQMLAGVEELTQIARRDDGAIACGKRILAPNSPVSMNFWGFTSEVFPLLEESLAGFLRAHSASERDECYIPSAVGEMIARGQADVCLLETSSDWFGVTYREDRDHVVQSIGALVRAGKYPEAL
ncbi:MAG: hypothetical protein WCI38_07025 [Chthoniobacterales bacterium]|jgi:dTDP-glucose pyrophosphorylase